MPPHTAPRISGSIASPIPATSSGAPRLLPMPRRAFASRLFGYDLFISFALGPPPRGTHSYASDLARQMRERDFTVFFSEDEAPPGEQLDSTLRHALLRSKALVVIANRGTLEDPRWVRTEVEEFRSRRPNRSVIPISVDGALQDPTLSTTSQTWLGFQDKIWLDESREAVETGIANPALIERLATAPTRVRSNSLWRWLSRTFVLVLLLLAVGLAFATWRAEIARQRAVGERLAAEAQFVEASHPSWVSLSTLLAAEAMKIYPTFVANQTLRHGLEMMAKPLATMAHEGGVNAVVFSPNGKTLATASGDKTVRLWSAATGKELQRLTHQDGVSAVVFSPDGNTLATTSGDTRNVLFDKNQTARLWSVTTGKELHRLAHSVLPTP